MNSEGTSNILCDAGEFVQCHCVGRDELIRPNELLSAAVVVCVCVLRLNGSLDESVASGKWESGL